MKKVFISYSHDSDEHSKRVRELADRLSKDGIEVIIDAQMLPGGPPNGWPQWSEEQVENADQVLVVCTETYCRRYELEEEPGKGLGSVCEARAIRQYVYDQGGNNEKVRVILFTENDEQNIPTNLKSYHHFPLHKPNVYKQLRQWLQAVEDSLNSKSLAEESTVQWTEIAENHEWLIADRNNIYQHFTGIITGQKKERILLISGNSSKGKTVLLYELCKYAKQQNITNVFLDFKGCTTLDDLFENLLAEMDNSLLPQTVNGKELKRQHTLISDLKKIRTPLLLVFDAYEDASDEAKRWLESQLLLRLKQAPAIIVVVAGHEVPERDKYSWKELATEYDLPPIDKVQDWQEFINKKWNGSKITKDQVEVLTKSTAGNPALVFSLLEVYVKTLQAEEKS